MVRLTRADAAPLLAAGRPELAVFAAWAVHDQRGAKARGVVRDAVKALAGAPDAALRASLVRAMVSMLDEPLVDELRELLMDPNAFPETPSLQGPHSRPGGGRKDQGRR